MRNVDQMIWSSLLGGRGLELMPDKSQREGGERERESLFNLLIDTGAERGKPSHGLQRISSNYHLGETVQLCHNCPQISSF